MTRRFRFLLSCVLLAAAGFGVSLPARGEVYLLGPGTGQAAGAGNGGAAAAGVLDVPSLYRERMVVNDLELKLEAANSDMNYRELLRFLSVYAPGAVRLGKSGFFFDRKLPNGWLRRYLISDMGELPALIFRIDLPKKLPPAAAWPEQLPLPAGAIPGAVIRYPDRGAVYGAFRNAGPREQSLAQTADELRAAGWRPVSGEPYGRNPQGEMFLRDNPAEILLLGIDAAGNGIAYRRRQGSIR